MKKLRQTFPLHSDEANSRLDPRSDLLVEIPDLAQDDFGGDRDDSIRNSDGSSSRVWTQQTGPFESYKREIEVDESSSTLTETIEFRLNTPYWRFLLEPAFKKALSTTEQKQRWWWPDDVADSYTAQLISVLAIYSLISGFLGGIIGQTIGFIGEDLNVSEADQASALAWIRIGIVISIFVLPLADRFGRRPLIQAVSLAAIGFTVVGAFATSLTWIVVTQALARAFVTAIFSLSTLAVIEQAPANWRARGVTVMGLSAGLGAAFVVPMLPLTDINVGFWRSPFALSALLILFFISAGKKLEETKRFQELTSQTESRPSFSPKDRRNLVAVGVVLFCSTFFFTPFSQLRNTFLIEDLDWSGTQITAFQIGISIPATVAVIIAGVLADRLGRRKVGITAIAIATIAGIASYNLPGLALSLAAGLSLTGSAMAVPATYGYKSELFDTRVRSRANGYLDVVLVAGSGLGLASAAFLIDELGGIAAAITTLSVSYVLMAIVFALFLPETTNTELEDLSEPSDAPT